MSEWWTYSLADFLMFSPGTYQRMFALHNAHLWPAQLLAVPLAVGVLWVMARRPAAWRWALATVALGWAFTAWAFHWQRFAGIYTAAPWFAGLFAVQAALLGWMARPGSPWQLRAGPAWVRTIGLVLVTLAVVLLPWAGPLVGRPWQQAALFGMTPDASAVGTLGLLLLLERRGRPLLATALPWLAPAMWAAASCATLWALAMPDVWWLAGATVLAVGAAASAMAGRRSRMPVSYADAR